MHTQMYLIWKRRSYILYSLFQLSDPIKSEAKNYKTILRLARKDTKINSKDLEFVDVQSENESDVSSLTYRSWRKSEFNQRQTI